MTVRKRLIDFQPSYWANYYCRLQFLNITNSAFGLKRQLNITREQLIPSTSIARTFAEVCFWRDSEVPGTRSALPVVSFHRTNPVRVPNVEDDPSWTVL